MALAALQYDLVTEALELLDGATLDAHAATAQVVVGDVVVVDGGVAQDPPRTQTKDDMTRMSEPNDLLERSDSLLEIILRRPKFWRIGEVKVTDRLAGDFAKDLHLTQTFGSMKFLGHAVVNVNVGISSSIFPA